MPCSWGATTGKSEGNGIKMVDLCSKAKPFWPREELGVRRPARHSLSRR